VFNQILRNGGRALRRKIVRARTHDAAHGTKSNRDEDAVGQIPNAQSNIDLIIKKMRDAISPP